VREYAERMRESAFVAQAALLAQDPIGAAFNARLAVQSALHATLCAHGLPFTGDKWLRERLEIDAPMLVGSHEAFAVLPATPERVGEFVRAAVDACEGFAGLDLSLAALAPQLRFDAGDLKLFPAAAERYLVSVQRDALWELDEVEAQTWNGLSAPPLWACDAHDAAALKLSFELYALGAAKLRWQRGLRVAELAFGEGVIA